MSKEKDVVCGMDVDPATALSVEKDGKPCFFCSDSCKAKFEKDPASFVKTAAPHECSCTEDCHCKHCPGFEPSCVCLPGKEPR